VLLVRKIFLVCVACGGGSGDLLLGGLLGRLEGYQHQHGDEQQAYQGGVDETARPTTANSTATPAVPVRAMRTQGRKEGVESA
jgi:hypothetical protein